MLEQLEYIVETVGKASQAKKQAIGSLFGDDEEMMTVSIELKDMPEFEDKEILEFEKASLGFYVSGHPLDKYRETLDEINYTLSSEFDELEDGTETLLVGKIENIQKRISKKGNPFGIATIMDLHGSFEIMMFDSLIKELEEDFDLNKPISMKVKVTVDDFGTKFNIKKVQSLKEAKSVKLKTKKTEVIEPTLNVFVEYSNDVNILYKIFEVVSTNQGKRDMTITIKSKLGNIEVDSGYKINKNVPTLLEAIDGVYCE
jgi:DNA polymerase-3 subunit alpha